MGMIALLGAGSRKEMGGLINFICTSFPVSDFLELSFLPCSNKVVTKQIHFTQGPANFYPWLVSPHLVSQEQIQGIYTCPEGSS